MKTEHTPEPWRVGRRGNDVIGSNGLGDTVAMMIDCDSDEQTHANARRIVACVNACAGISTENLEDNKPIIELANAYNVALRQRDELLAALEYIRGLAACEEVRDFPTIHNTANAAIASVKGSAA